MDILLEENVLTAMYNTAKNSKERCDYNCGQRFMNDSFMQQKLNVCKANCDVVWEQQYIRQLQQYVSQSQNDMNADFRENISNRMQVARKRLENAKMRLIKTKLVLRKTLYGRRASMSMRPVQNGPAYER